MQRSNDLTHHNSAKDRDIDSDQLRQVLRETGDRTQTPAPGHCIEQWPALKPRAWASV